MRKRKMIIRNEVIGDPIDFYIEIKEMNAKRRNSVLERMPWSDTASKLTLRADEERSIIS